MQERFEFSPGWYREGEVRELVLQYYQVLRSVLRANPHLRRCLTRCVHCGIFFITDPRNAGRRDLRCPFGCREAHRKQRSSERSVAYYRTEEGKIKKQIQNDKRSRSSPASERKVVPGVVQGRSGFDRGMVVYLVVAVSLIEGRAVSMEEVLEMLERAVRQHSLARQRRTEYIVWRLNKDPP